MLERPIVSSQTLSRLGRRKAEPLARAGEGGPLQEGQGQRRRRDLLASVGGWGRLCGTAGRWRRWQGTLPPPLQDASPFIKTNTMHPALHDISEAKVSHGRGTQALLGPSASREALGVTARKCSSLPFLFFFPPASNTTVAPSRASAL